MKYSNLKLAHAKKLLQEFRIAYHSFVNLNYKIKKETNNKLGRSVARLGIKSDTPEEWGPMIGDIVHNLRSSLDLLISDLLIDNGNQPNNKSAFPVSISEKTLLDKDIKKLKGLKDETINKIIDLKPHADGNVRLWQLHQLDIFDKHRVITPIISENKAVVVNFGGIPIALRPSDRKIHDGIILYDGPTDSDFPNFQFEPVFGPGEILDGESVSDKLNEFVDLVESIIHGIS